MPRFFAATALLLAGCSLPAAAPPIALEGRAWSLQALRGKALPELPLHRIPRVELRAGRISGFSGCNRLAGAYTLKGEALQFGPAAGTRMACVDGMALEQDFLQSLGQVARWRAAEGGGIEWLDAQGQSVVRFSDAVRVYACNDGSTVLARYAEGGVTLSLGGRQYLMRSAPAASGARYVVEQGRSPEQSMEWHSKGDEGLLLEAPLDHTRKPEDLKPFATCRIG